MTPAFHHHSADMFFVMTFFCRWITPVLLIIDFYEKMAVSSKRREQMNKVKKNNNNTKPKQNVKNTATNYSSEVKNEKISLGTAIKMSIYEGKGGGEEQHFACIHIDYSWISLLESCVELAITIHKGIFTGNECIGIGQHVCNPVQTFIHKY